MIEKIESYIKQSEWTQKDIAKASGVPLHFISDLASGRIKKGTADYKNDDTINKHINTLNNFFKPYTKKQEILGKRQEKANSEKDIVLNKSNYKSKSVLGGVEYEAQYNYQVAPVNMLIYDIEVSPNLGAFYGAYKVHPLKILREQEIMSFAYKEFTIDENHTILDSGDAEVKCITLADVGFDHDKMIKKLWEIFNRNKIICGFNNKGFDDKYCHRYFIKQNLPVPLPAFQFDIFKEWKKIGKLSKNGLDYLNKYFNDDGKTDETYADLWEKCWLNKDKEAYRKLAEYNEQDVVLTEKLLHTLLPYMKDTINLSLLMNHPCACPKCGAISSFDEAEEHYYTNVGRYHQYRCKRCGSYVHGRYQDSTLKIDDQYVDVRPILKS